MWKGRRPEIAPMEKEMDEKDRHIITFDIDPDENEELSVSQKVVIPEMKPTPPETKPAAPEFNVPSGNAPERSSVPDFNLTPSSEPVKPATEINMAPDTDPVKSATPEFNMTPSSRPDASKSLASDFWSINRSSKIESASEEFDDAQDEAAGIKKPTPSATVTPKSAEQTPGSEAVVSTAGASHASVAAVGAQPKVQEAVAPPKTPAASNVPKAPAPVGTVNTGSSYTRPATSGSSGTIGSSGGGSGGSHYASTAPKPVKPKKQKKYVTRGGLIACMILTMLLSTFLGTLLGTGLSRLNNFSNNPDDNRAERNDEKLSNLNLGDATGSELTVAEIVDMNEDAVVEIVVSGTTQGMWGQLQLTEGAGSGVIIREDGYIATNYHVIHGANKVQVTLHNGNAYPATIIGSDPANDVAVVKIDEKDLKAVTIGDSSTVDVGDLAVAIGNPLGQLGGSVTTGIISALDRTLSVEGTTLTLLQTDAAINGGNSGGGLFNSRGELIGIVESKASAVGVEGLGFALPINSVSQILNDIIESGGNVSGQTAGTPAVGIVISDVSEEQSQYYGLSEPGVYIAQVTGQNAMQAGFQEQDRIVSFNGSKVENSSEFIALVRKCKVGDTVTIVVDRGGQEIEIKTVLEELQTQQ